MTAGIRSRPLFFPYDNSAHICHIFYYPTIFIDFMGLY